MNMAGETPCVEYPGTRNARGYGVLPRAKWGTRLAHRAALADALGRPVRGVARHSCDNPPCINPAHLAEGTQWDNVNDAVERGRTAGGRCYSKECTHGHAFTAENTAYKTHASTRGPVRERVCKTCRARRNKEQAARRKAARHASKEKSIVR